jgi:uncharacterized caspase-like protein/Flp pilus assembly protein TadD
MAAASLCFCWPAPNCLAQPRGQGVRKPASSAASAGSEPRVALVIGNGAYADGALANSVNDARDMAAALRQLGFDVSSGENLNRRQMEDLIRSFGKKIRGGGVGMFYFAGHGVQVSGANYLIPVGATINGEAEVKYEAVDAGFVLAQMEEAQNRLNIVILDACRNNPFARSFRSASSGLATIDAPVGTLIAYATAPGRTASDGNGRNGLYTQELLAAMRLPGLKIEDVFKRVRAEVRRQSNDQQIPWEASSIEGDFYFSTSGVRPAPAAPAPAPTTSTPAPTLAEMLREAAATLRHRDYDGVISAAEKALGADPNSGVAYRFLYEAYGFQHEIDRSKQAWDNAIRLLQAPKTAEEYEARGRVSQDSDFQRAIADYSEAIRIDPTFAMAYNNRGDTYLRHNDPNRAIADLSEAIRLDPNYANAHLNRGEAYMENKWYDRAIADFSEAIRIDQKYAAAYNDRGLTYRYVKDYSQAIADFNEAIRINPNSARAYRNRAGVYNEIKNYDLAIMDLNEAIRLEPSYAAAYQYRAIVYRQIGRKDLAEADERTAKRLGVK